MLLQLRPALLRARRGPGRLQVGAGPDRAVVLTGLGDGDERLLALLDGTLDLAGLLDRAVGIGVDPARAAHLVHVLTSAGVLLARPAQAEDAGRRPPRRTAGEQRALAPDAALLSLVHPDGEGWAVLAARWRASVRVVGASRTGLGIALGLAAAGVGRVVVEDATVVGPGDVSPGGYGVDDVGHPRGVRAAALLRLRCPLVLTTPAATTPAATAGAVPAARGSVHGRQVVVLTAAGAVDAGAGDALLRDAVPHLAVLWREGVTVVGPLVRPGRSPCLRCLDHHRTDRDPQWPSVAAQLSAVPPGTRTRPEETALAALTAALAVVQVLAELDGAPRPAALGTTLETALPEGLVAQRPWSPHPRCGCTWLGSPPVGAAAGERRG